MGLSRTEIIEALTLERGLSLQGAPFEVLEAGWEADLIVLSVRRGVSVRPTTSCGVAAER